MSVETLAPAPALSSPEGSLSSPPGVLASPTLDLASPGISSLDQSGGSLNPRVSISEILNMPTHIPFQDSGSGIRTIYNPLVETKLEPEVIAPISSFRAETVLETESALNTEREADASHAGAVYEQIQSFGFTTEQKNLWAGYFLNAFEEKHGQLNSLLRETASKKEPESQIAPLEAVSKQNVAMPETASETKQEISIQPEIQTGRETETETEAQSANRTESEPQTLQISEQEKEADRKLAAEVKDQIETDKSMETEEKHKWQEKFQRALEAKDEQNQKPKPETEAPLQPEVFIPQPINPVWEVKSIRHEVTVDTANNVVGFKTREKHEKTVFQSELARKVAPEAQTLADMGANSITHDKHGWRAGHPQEINLKDLAA